MNLCGGNRKIFHSSILVGVMLTSSPWKQVMMLLDPNTKGAFGIHLRGCSSLKLTQLALRYTNVESGLQDTFFHLVCWNTSLEGGDGSWPAHVYALPISDVPDSG